MNDQAENLRRLLDKNEDKDARVLAVVSGKGGVGKSNVCLNFAISLSQLGKKVMIFDLDLGMANLNILMGLNSKYHLMDMLDNQLSIWDIVEEGPAGISYIAGGSGFSNFVELSEERLHKFFAQLEFIGNKYDYILLDMGAGATKESLEFVMAAHDVLVVTTPEPTAITDAYSMIKFICLKDPDKPLHLIVNRVDSDREGQRTMESFRNVALQFLQKDIMTLGSIPYDSVVSKAVKAQTPFVLFDKHTRASSAITQIASRYIGEEISNSSAFGHFLSKMKTMISFRK
ncbi:MinD/ParA family protein [Halalkalibacter akibai]|uniref:Flagellar synthesis regulator FleN n=1 Tax=Halalkalibacter akibai (strain ATCC 43226 / DSM 21942 / CIP 109018 / JCM 9157 / 1139) TaxID=1236973 RepID=W4QWM6_HALA3|nr:MinD/ParA family protein [Halalkalibacter akibai]GAE36048.1 flagellar synthesis regulator FleN [Halalkalibacter akibai JCM 9157]